MRFMCVCVCARLSPALLRKWNWSVVSEAPLNVPVPPPSQTLHYTEIVLIRTFTCFNFFLSTIITYSSRTHSVRLPEMIPNARAHTHTHRMKNNFRERKKKNKKISLAINNRQSIGKHWTTKNKNIAWKKPDGSWDRTEQQHRPKKKKQFMNTFFEYVIMVVIFCAIKRFANTHPRHRARMHTVTPYCSLIVAHCGNCIRALHAQLHGAKKKNISDTGQGAREAKETRVGLRPLPKIASRK